MIFKKQTFMLVLVMASIIFIVEGMTLFTLYNTAFEKQRDQLIATARSQAALITEVAKFDLVHSQNAHKDGAKAATLSQIDKAYHNFKGFGKSGELVVGTLEGNTLKYLVRSRFQHSSEKDEVPTMMGADKAVLLQQALLKKSGSIISKDYNGKMTLGAYEYIKPLNYGVVVKIDIDEVRAPFVEAGIISVIVTIVLTILGAIIICKITNPIIRKLQESDEYNRMLFDSSPIGLALADMEGRLTDVNQTYANIIGRSIEETKQVSYWDITPKEYMEQEAQQLESLQKTAKYGPYEKEYIHKDGSRIAVSLLGHLIERHGKKYIWSSVEDISKRKEVERNFLLNETRLNEAQRLAKVGSWELDLLTGELVWSDEIYNMFEIDKKKFSASYDAFLNAIHPDDRDKVNAAYTQSLETRKAYEISHRLKMANGTIKYVSEKCESYFDNDNKPVRSVGTVQDITEREVIEQKLEEFKGTLDKTLDCVFMFDAENLIFYYVNEGALRQVGYTRDEMLLMHAYDIKPDISESEFHKLITPLVKGEKLSLNFETVHEHKNGKRIPVEISLQYIAPENELARYVAIVRDITERKKIESELEKHREHLEELIEERTQELQDAQEVLVRKERLATLGQLTATVSHELRNPLGAMRPSLYVIGKKCDKNDEHIQNAISRIDRSIDRCDRIIDELLDFTRISKLNLQPTKIDEWLESVIDEQVIAEGIHLDRYFSLKDVESNIDTDSMRRAVINVIENGCHAMMDDNQQLVTDKKANLIIKTTCNEQRLEIVIADSGSGIEKEVLTKIFEPLFSTKGFGIGLGMPVVKQIMEQHGGGIDIDSIADMGTTVTLWLPLTQLKNE